MESPSSDEDFLFRFGRVGYLLCCVEEASGGVGRPALEGCFAVEAVMDCCCGGMVMVIWGDWNRGLVSLTPSRPNWTTSSSPEVERSIGIDDRSGLSRSSDLRKKSDSGDCSILSHEVHSSPVVKEEAKPLKMGETGETDPGDGAESVVRSAALQSSMEL